MNRDYVMVVPHKEQLWQLQIHISTVFNLYVHTKMVAYMPIDPRLLGSVFYILDYHYGVLFCDKSFIFCVVYF